MKLDELISSKKRLAVLVDPDKFNPVLIDEVQKSAVSFFLVGGSKLKKNNFKAVVNAIRKRSDHPLLIFPGDETQISKNADGMLLLSLISGRNPEYLIGKHVKAAKKIKESKLRTVPTGYILVDGDTKSTTQKITGTEAIRSADIKTICSTVMAAELLGMQALYLEAGSGARKHIKANLIKAVKKSSGLPLFVGGGIDTAQKAATLLKAGADIVVVGNALEKNLYLFKEIEKAFL